MWTVYYHQSKINGKIYIGITGLKPEKRWGTNGQKYKHSPHFFAAINKDGWDSFYHEIFASGLTREEAENMEQILISSFRTNDPAIGYNIENGGSIGGIGAYHDSEKAREGARDRFKAVECIETGERFETIADCAAFYDITRCAIRESCRHYEEGKQSSNSKKGHHFKFIEHT